MSDKDLTLGFVTTADNTGSEQTVEGIKDVEREVTILDSNQKLSIEEQTARREAFALKQKEWAAESSGVTYGMASDYEAAAQRAANAAEIEAAAQEAAGVRAEIAAAATASASAEKAAAEQAAAIKIEAALAAETAAAEAAAIADQAIAEKKIANAAIRALTPRSRELSAAMSVVNSPEAMAALINPYTATAAAVVSLGVVSHLVFGQIADDMNAGTAAGSKFAEQNKATAITIGALGHPWEAVKAATSNYFGWVGDQYRYLGNEIAQYYDDTVGDGIVANMRMQASDAQLTKTRRDDLEKQTTDHHEYTKQRISDEIALQTSIDNLARGREQRAGTDSGKAASNELDRLVQNQALKDAKLIDSINSAQEVVDQAAEDLVNKNIGRSEEELEAIRKRQADGVALIRKLGDQLGLQREQESNELINSQESGQKANNDNLNAKLTANAQALQTQLQAVVDAKGKDASPLTQAALKTVNDLLSNGITTQADAAKLQSAAQQFRQSVDSNSQAQQASIQSLITSNQAAIDNAKKLTTHIAGATTAVEAITKTTLADLQTHQDDTVKSIKSLAPTPADTQAIATAGNATAKAITDQGNAYLEAISNLRGAVELLNQQIKTQKQQIDNLSARIR